ncbi:hypothetical protein [Intestinibacter sp.]|uniref:hypothetical protein n=1 Tax=Intestinibacter sp. TaxID=1965304 RepID=UPI002A918D65|nr:hypothetical protein [Intestinibacter sp.]MDY5211117.1 hypothetical protein [Intestinibacter sp.]
MKKAIISVISVLCVGLMVVGPVREAYANNSNKEEQKTSQVVATKTDVKTDKKEADKVKEQATEATEKQDMAEVTTNNQSQNVAAKKENVAVNTTATEQKQPQATNNVVNKEQPKVEESQPVVEQKVTLSQAQALQLVKAYEPGVAGYDYMGDENTYPCIKEQGIQGYVFLPQCDGDMAYLVDKNSGHIYFFHPSGYFDLLK